MKIQNDIPLAVINKRNYTIIYFDINQIQNPDNIDKAYIISESLWNCSKNTGVRYTLNDRLSSDDIRLIKSSRGKSCIHYNPIGNGTIDITDCVQLLVSKTVMNKGIAIETEKQLYDCSLVIIYQKGKIFPSCGCAFFEKEINILRYIQKTQSPWFYTGESMDITFYVVNNGKSDIAVSIENSPNANSIIDDGQRIIVPFGQTADIIPRKFSKFTRLAISSKDRPIAVKLWFQTQLID